MRITKGRIKFGYKDVVDFSTLGDVIGDWLKDFKKVHQQHAFAGAWASVLGETDLDDHCYSEGVLEDAVQEMYRRIDAMIYAFTEEEPDYEGRIEFITEPRGDGYSVLHTDTYDDMWMDYLATCKAHKDKVQYGLDLFAKHYEDLWI